MIPTTTATAVEHGATTATVAPQAGHCDGGCSKPDRLVDEGEKKVLTRADLPERPVRGRVEGTMAGPI